ncbi:MAG: hypothetical protein CMO31_05805 [Trueperaceae bacterium]|nr:hypothetical protein [Trueperaceae bacterium]
MSPANNRAQTSPVLLSGKTQSTSPRQVDLVNAPEDACPDSDVKDSTLQENHFDSLPKTDSRDSIDTEIAESPPLNAHRLKGPLDESRGLPLTEGLREYVKNLQAIFPGKFLGLKPGKQTSDPESAQHSTNLDNSN